MTSNGPYIIIEVFIKTSLFTCEDTEKRTDKKEMMGKGVKRHSVLGREIVLIEHGRGHF